MAYNFIWLRKSRSRLPKPFTIAETKTATGASRLPAIAAMLWLMATLAPAPWAEAAVLSDPQVDAYGIRVGTQTFAPLYSFTPTNALIETALAIRGMGSDSIKFSMGSGAQGQYKFTFPSGITNLETQARNEPYCHAVLDMPFTRFVIWAYSFSVGTGWTDGLSSTERQKEYGEVYALTRFLLTNYNNSAKSFYLGHWEGDWYLLPGYDASTNPTPARISAMIDWLNTRQLAVDDAVRLTPHTNVSVFNYTEVNRVRDAMLNGPTNNQRLVNTVLPYVTNLDIVSYSSYDMQGLSTEDVYATLDYIAGKLSTNKAAGFTGKRVFIGEYGFARSYSTADQESPTRAYLQKLIGWGAPMMLFWEMYSNEPYPYWLIDSSTNKTPCYFLHQNFGNQARLEVGRFRERNGRVPTSTEFEAMMKPVLGAPLLTPPAISVANAGPVAIGADSATVSCLVRQNLYGDELARVRVFWGAQDGGTNRAGWQRQLLIGTNTTFNTAVFSATLTNLAPGTNFFRACATNASGEFWAEASTAFTTASVNTNDFGSRVKLTYSGYNRREPLANFPALVKLSTNIPGFSYRHFASPTGGDLRFVGADGRLPLQHEIDEWNTNGVSLVWVRLPLLTSTNDSIWACWGNPLAAAPPASSTNGTFWNYDHQLVWHMKEAALPFADSAGLHPATTGTAPASTTNGIVGRAGVFNGSSFLNAGLMSLGDSFTVSAWIKVATNASDIQTLWANKAGGYASDGFGLFVNSYQSTDRRLAFEAGNGTNGSRTTSDAGAVQFGQWQHIAVAVDRTNSGARMFVNGEEVTGAATIANDFHILGTLTLGRFTNSAFNFNGTIDEARVANVLQSAPLLRATWLNVASNATFAAFSPVSVTSPALSATYSPPNLRLAWPASAVAFTLQTTTNLAPSAAWTVVTNPPALVGSQWQLSLFMPIGPPRFYRLTRD